MIAIRNIGFLFLHNQMNIFVCHFKINENIEIVCSGNLFPFLLMGSEKLQINFVFVKKDIKKGIARDHYTNSKNTELDIQTF